MDSTKILKKSIIVVSHPDDEILWFSSIIDKVDEVVICFLNQNTRPDWSTGRKQSLSEYPMKNMSCLGIDESDAFHHRGANWHNPVITKFGIEIPKKTSLTRNT